MTTELIEARDGGVLTLTLNRPERLNALTPGMTDALLAALRRAAIDPAVRAVVLTGAGRGFCAGGDVKAMADSDGPPATLEARTHQLREHMECSRLLREMPKPTLAVVRGACAGAGLSLALACDLLVASDTLKLTSAFAKVGLSGDFGSTWFLTQLLGPRARAFALLSPVLKADEALQLGLAARVVPDAELDDAGRQLARQLAEGPTITLGHIKSNLNAAEQGATLSQALDHEAVRHIRCAMTEDHLEAARALPHGDPHVLLEEAAARVPAGSEGVMFLPYLMGERSPVWDAKASGAFIGLNLVHTRAHLYRAVLEGVAFALRHNIEAGRKGAQFLDDKLIVVGGAAHSDLWMQIIADVTGYPVYTIEQEVEAAMGAALLAAVGTSLVTDEVARGGWARLVERARPDADRLALYSDRFEVYAGLYPALKPLMHRLQAMPDSTRGR